MVLLLFLQNVFKISGTDVLTGQKVVVMQAVAFDDIRTCLLLIKSINDGIDQEIVGLNFTEA